MRFISLIVPEFRIDLLEIINDQYLLFPKNVITMKYRNIELDTIYIYQKNQMWNIVQLSTKRENVFYFLYWKQA